MSQILISHHLFSRAWEKDFRAYYKRDWECSRGQLQDGPTARIAANWGDVHRTLVHTYRGPVGLRMAKLTRKRARLAARWRRPRTRQPLKRGLRLQSRTPFHRSATRLAASEGRVAVEVSAAVAPMAAQRHRTAPSGHRSAIRTVGQPNWDTTTTFTRTAQLQYSRQLFGLLQRF